jgi:hypothetical protein
MTHTAFTFSKHAQMREDAMAFVLRGLRQFASSREFAGGERESFEKALEQWLGQHQLAPPGTSGVNLGEWINNEDRRQTVLLGLAWIETRWRDLIKGDLYEFLLKIGALNIDQLKRIVATANLKPIEEPPGS